MSCHLVHSCYLTARGFNEIFQQLPVYSYYFLELHFWRNRSGGDSSVSASNKTHIDNWVNSSYFHKIGLDASVSLSEGRNISNHFQSILFEMKLLKAFVFCCQTLGSITTCYGYNKRGVSHNVLVQCLIRSRVLSDLKYA